MHKSVSNEPSSKLFNKYKDKESPHIKQKTPPNITNLIVNGDVSPSHDRVLTTALALKEMLDITKEIKDECAQNQAKNMEKQNTTREK